MALGSITRARPGDEFAPERVSDFGPADFDRLTEQRSQQRVERVATQQNSESGVELFNEQDGRNNMALAGLAIGAVAVLAALTTDQSDQ